MTKELEHTFNLECKYYYYEIPKEKKVYEKLLLALFKLKSYEARKLFTSSFSILDIYEIKETQIKILLYEGSSYKDRIMTFINSFGLKLIKEEIVKVGIIQPSYYPYDGDIDSYYLYDKDVREIQVQEKHFEEIIRSFEKSQEENK